MKNKVAAYKRKMRTFYSLVTVLIVDCLLVAALHSAGFFTGSGGKTSVEATTQGHGNSNGGVRRAARAIDALSDSEALDDFTVSLNDSLRSAGLALDVFQGAQITVKFLESFSDGYKLVVFRVHSALSSNGELYLSTAEPYSNE